MFVCSPLTRCNVSLYCSLSCSVTVYFCICLCLLLLLFDAANRISNYMHMKSICMQWLCTHLQKPLHPHGQRNERKPARQKRSWLIQRAENEWLKTANTPINIGWHNNNNHEKRTFTRTHKYTLNESTTVRWHSTKANKTAQVNETKWKKREKTRNSTFVDRLTEKFVVDTVALCTSYKKRDCQKSQ